MQYNNCFKITYELHFHWTVFKNNNKILYIKNSPISLYLLRKLEKKKEKYKKQNQHKFKTPFQNREGS